MFRTRKSLSVSLCETLIHVWSSALVVVKLVASVLLPSQAGSDQPEKFVDAAIAELAPNPASARAQAGRTFVSLVLLSVLVEGWWVRLGSVRAPFRRLG